MLGHELQSLLLSDVKTKRIFGGIFPRDKLPKTIFKKPIIYIVNTDHSLGTGLHWVCIYVGVNHVIEYWDSFGFDIRHKEIYDFVHFNSIRYVYNNLVLQPLFSETCGYYCVFFAKYKSRGVSMRRILRHFRVERPHYNDFVVKRLYYK